MTRALAKFLGSFLLFFNLKGRDAGHEQKEIKKEEKKTNIVGDGVSEEGLRTVRMERGGGRGQGIICIA